MFYLASRRICARAASAQLRLTLEAVAEEYRPNYLCNYLFELAKNFLLLRKLPGVKAEDTGHAVRSRLVMCDLTARVFEARFGNAGHRNG